MDLRTYYRKVREIEANITEPDVVVVSRATAQGGRAGVLVETPRAVAARLIADGTAELASAEQAAAYREQLREACATEERRRAAARIQVSVISEADARTLSDPGRAPRSGRREPRSDS